MFYTNELRHDKTNKVTVRPAKTQISLGMRPVCSESSLSALRKLGSLATHWAHSEDSDQTGRFGFVMSRLKLLNENASNENSKVSVKRITITY